MLSLQQDSKQQLLKAMRIELMKFGQCQQMSLFVKEQCSYHKVHANAFTSTYVHQTHNVWSTHLKFI